MRLFIILFAVLTLSNCGKNLYEIAEPDHPGLPLMLINFDSRNIQSIKFIEDILGYLHRNGINVNVGIVYLNSKIINFGGNFTVYEKKAFRGKNILQDSFNIFDYKGKLLLRGPLSEISDSLLNLLDPKYVLDNQQIFNDIRNSSKTLDDITFTECMKSSLSTSITCFILYDQFCLCNSSVDTINKIMEIEKKSKDIHHFIVPMFKYSQEEISLLKHNNNYTVEFISPHNTDLENWEFQKKDPLHKNPLNGLLLLVDEEGVILLFSKDWQEYVAWREEHL